LRTNKSTGGKKREERVEYEITNGEERQLNLMRRKKKTTRKKEGRKKKNRRIA